MRDYANDSKDWSAEVIALLALATLFILAVIYWQELGAAANDFIDFVLFDNQQQVSAYKEASK